MTDDKYELKFQSDEPDDVEDIRAALLASNTALRLAVIALMNAKGVKPNKKRVDELGVELLRKAVEMMTAKEDDTTQEEKPGPKFLVINDPAFRRTQ